MKLTLLFMITLSVISFQWGRITFLLQKPQEQLTHLIDQDLKKLADKKMLPQAWDSIGSIEVFGDKTQKTWIHTVVLPISLKPGGNRHLEVQILPWKIEGKKGAVINYHLIDRASNNTVWEFGRTFELGYDSAAKEPEKNS